MFISSIPICLLALAQGGIPKLLVAIGLIVAVHAVESYVLNPKIFGTHMKLNPVMVMILMTVSGKLFGVWGLVLCLPVTTYLFQDAIQLKKRLIDRDEEDDKDEAEPENRASGPVADQQKGDEVLPRLNGTVSSGQEEPQAVVFRGPPQSD